MKRQASTTKFFGAEPKKKTEAEGKYFQKETQDRLYGSRKSWKFKI